MYKLLSFRKLASALASLVLLFTVVGCGTSTPVIQDRLDPTTGVTITHVDSPMVFYHDGSSRAAYAYDFVNMGPIQVNRMGQHRYYLWLGIWGTMQDTNAGESLDGFDSIVIYADGEPLQLSLSGRAPNAIGASDSVYLKPTASPADGYYEVTADQLRFIARASDVRLQTSGPLTRSYEPWNGQDAGRRSMQAFLAHVDY
jgi:hypothetical protein